MCARESNSYYIVGLTTLDLSSNTPSLYLYSLNEEENMKRIHFPIEDIDKKDENNDQENEICFVSMISFPMSDSLLDLFIPTLGIETIENMKPGECSSHSDTNNNNMQKTISNPSHLYIISFKYLFNVSILLIILRNAASKEVSGNIPENIGTFYNLRALYDFYILILNDIFLLFYRKLQSNRISGSIPPFYWGLNIFTENVCTFIFTYIFL